MKKILIIGGTQFIGRAITEKLIRDGRYELCLFNRGKTNPDLFPQIRTLKGDRYTDEVNQIGQENWDYIIDVTAYYPDALQRALALVKDDVEQYILVSTMSVYDLKDGDGPIREAHPILPCSRDERNSKEMATYGKRKAACEREVHFMADMPSLILRPMLVVGPHDPTDRLYYWLHRVKHYNEILVPEQGQHHIGGWTDVIDFAELVVRSLGRKDLEPAYHVPTASKVSIDQILRIAAAALGREPQRIAASTAFLKEEEVRAWWDMPLWVGGDYYEFDDELLKRDFAIRFRSMEKSIRSCIDYYDSLGWPEPQYGMSREREEELIKKLS